MAKAPFDPYEVLGVPKDADEKAIRQGYRRASKGAHPDAPGGSAAAFDRVSTALAVLSDPKRRSQYDRTGQWDDIEPDNEIAGIINSIGTAIDVVLNDPRLAAIALQTDMVVHVVGVLNVTIENATHQKRMAAAAAARLEKFVGRFAMRESDRPNVFELALRGKIDRHREDIKSAESAIENARRAIEFCKNASFRMDAPPPFNIYGMRNQPYAGTAYIGGLGGNVT